MKFLGSNSESSTANPVFCPSFVGTLRTLRTMAKVLTPAWDSRGREVSLSTQGRGMMLMTLDAQFRKSVVWES